MNWLIGCGRRRVFQIGILLSSLLPVVGNAAADTDQGIPHFEGFTQSYQIPFAHPVDFKSLKGMYIRVSLNGGPEHNFQVDTGSCGIVVGANDVPNIDPKAPAGSLTYSSSGVEMDGVLTPVTVTFLDSKDANGRPATAIVPVLAVTESKALGVGVNSAGRKGSKHPHPFMFGVGFGRGKDPHPDRNPFLNLSEMLKGTMCRGYTITHEGVTLGLTAQNVGSGYVYQKLKERDLPAEMLASNHGLKDWETSPGWVDVGSVRLPMCGVLMDTGLTNMIIRAPNAPNEQDLPEHAVIKVNLLDGKLHYSFAVGDTTDPVMPRKVSWLVPDPDKPVTLNTGLRALAIYDYLFDASDGYLGLRPTAKHQ